LQLVSKLDTFSLNLLSSVAWIVISSIAFTNSVAFSVDVPTLVDVPVIGMVVVGGSVGAKEAANVEGIAIETVGMIVYGVVANSLC